jgi:hypothetical protein
LIGNPENDPFENVLNYQLLLERRPIIRDAARVAPYVEVPCGKALGVSLLGELPGK